MRSVALPLLGLVASAAAGTVSVPFTRRHPERPASLVRRDGSLDLEAVNNVTGGGYYAEFEIGTPGQKISFLLDTGSSDTWVNSVNADLCSSDSLQSTNGYCMTTFDADASDTYKSVDPNGFDITYLDGRNIQGSYFNDTVTIGDAAIKSQQLGLALESVRPTGIMGLGFSINVAADRPYATVIDNMLAQGHINTAAFSLYLNDLSSNSGTVLFGGVDSDKFIGDLAKLPLIKDPETTSENITSFTINMDGFGVNAPDSADVDADDLDFSGTAILDSGSTLSLLPSSQVRDIYDLFDVETKGLGIPFVDCSWGGDKGEDYSFDFKFEGKTIRVPLNELVIDAFADDQDIFQGIFDYDEVCMFGMASTSDYGINSDEWVLLGDTFLRSAYVVYDLANMQLGLAQANLNSDKSNVTEFDADTDDIPNVTGVEAQEDDDNAAGNLAPFATSALVTLMLVLAAIV